VDRAPVLDTVAVEGVIVLKLLAYEDQALLVRWDPFLIPDLLLEINDGAERWHNALNRLSSKRFHEQCDVNAWVGGKESRRLLGSRHDGSNGQPVGGDVGLEFRIPKKHLLGGVIQGEQGISQIGGPNYLDVALILRAGGGRRT